MVNGNRYALKNPILFILLILSKKETPKEYSGSDLGLRTSDR